MPVRARSAFTVNEGRQIVGVGHHLEKAHHFFLVTVPWLGFKPHAFQAGPGRLVLVRMPRAQVDDRPDAHDLQLRHAFGRRLRPAIKIRGDLKTISDAGHLDLLRPMAGR